MSDILDIASEREEIARVAAIQANSKAQGPSPTGRCLWCEDSVSDQLRWCCVGCRDEWQAQAKRTASH